MIFQQIFYSCAFTRCCCIKMENENMKNTTSISSAGNIAFAAILCFVGIAGIAGNTILIFDFAKKSKQFLFLIGYKQIFLTMMGLHFHLAIANIMLLLTIPFYSSEKLNGYWNLSQSACKFYKGIIYFTYSISLLAISARIVIFLILENYGK